MSNFKIFIRDGKLWGNEFPEEPCDKEIYTHQKAVWDKMISDYNATVEAAKASAVEADSGTGFYKALLNAEGIATGEGSEHEVIFALNSLEEVKLYNLPTGWTVEYKYQFEAVNGKIARLIPASKASDSPVIPEGSEKTLEQQGEELLAQFSGALTDSQKQEIVEKALNTAAYALGLAFRVCDLKTHINGTVVIKDQKFDISFTPESADKQAIDDTLKGSHGMDKLMIHRFQAKTIKNALRLAMNVLNSRIKKDQTAMDRELLKADEFIENILTAAAQPSPQAESAFLKQNRIWLEVVEMTQADPNFIDAIMGDLHKNYHITRKP